MLLKEEGNPTVTSFTCSVKRCRLEMPKDNSMGELIESSRPLLVSECIESNNHYPCWAFLSLSPWPFCRSPCEKKERKSMRTGGAHTYWIRKDIFLGPTRCSSSLVDFNANSSLFKWFDRDETCESESISCSFSSFDWLSRTILEVQCIFQGQIRSLMVREWEEEEWAWDSVRWSFAHHRIRRKVSQRHFIQETMAF